MENKKDEIILKDNNLSPEIYRILNECYLSFKVKYGEKHSSHIKELIESITDKIKTADLYYTGSAAIADRQTGIIYTESQILPCILKHELWHVFNTNNNINHLSYTPQQYITQLEQNGYLRQLYEQTMADAKIKWKNDPARLEFILVDYDTFVKEYGIDDHEIEKWTEWFNSTTNSQDMTDNFWNWSDGYFTKHTSSKSFYDCYINIADMISCLIPKENLLEMYLQTEDYPTDYSYPQMIDDFDEQYSGALDEQERTMFKYPYLKIMMDTKVISDNARTNPEIAKNALQSCMKTCFNAYSIKLDNIKDIDIATAQQLYAEIKYMQEHMMWNTDLSKMLELDSVQAMQKIESQFRELLQTLDIQNPDVKNMLDNISFIENSAFKFIPGGEKIAQQLQSAEKTPKDEVVNVGQYKIATSKNGIKDNLYCTLSTLLGNKKFNLLYQDFQKTDNNMLVKFYNRIEQASTEDEFINIYNDMYELYVQRLEDTLRTNENIDFLFREYKTELIQLQENALFDMENNSYLPGLEKALTIYKNKAQEYQICIDGVTEKKILEDSNHYGISLEDAKKWNTRFPNEYKGELQGRILEIDSKKEILYEKYNFPPTFPSKALDTDLTQIASQVKLSDFNAISHDIKRTEQSNEQTHLIDTENPTK